MREYPSDISREEYKLIQEDLEGAKKATRPRKYDLYDVFCAVVKQIRNEDLRRDKTTFGIVDAQSVQNADTAEEKGYDTGRWTRVIPANDSQIR